MDTEELRKLLDEATPGPWVANTENTVCNQIDGAHHAICTDQFCYAPPAEKEANARLIAIAPTLARKVIAAEKLAEAVRGISFSDNGIDLSKALAAWEAAQ